MNKKIALCLALSAATSCKPEAVSLGVKEREPYALYHAAKTDNVDALKKFISAGKAVEEKEEQPPWPAYAKAALELIEKKVDINAKDKEGYTPLHTAVKVGNTATVWALIAKGADINAKDKYDWTPLHWAALKGNTAVARLLLDKKATINAEDKDGWTPLHLAARYGRVDVARLLLDNNANVNVKSKNGWTPLHWAARKGSVEVARLLLENDANVNAKITKGFYSRKTPLWVARATSWRNTEAVQTLLRKHGGR